MVEFQTGWGWQPALYLFLGGLAGGTFIVAGLIHFLSKGRLKSTVAGGMGFALVCLALGLVVLITDVSQPLRAMAMWDSFSNFDSWMAIGAWLLFAAAVFFAIATVLNADLLRSKLLRRFESSTKGDTGGDKKAAISDSTADSSETNATRESNTDDDLPLRSPTSALLSNGCVVIGMVLALGVVVYTGILLASAPGISFWNSWTLPVLFTLSALDTGVAAIILVSLITEKDEAAEVLRSILEKVTMVLILCEVGALALLITNSDGAVAAASADALVNGWLKVPFWTFVIAIGLLVPFAIALFSLAMRKKGISKWVAVAGSCCILVGGCALRLVVVYAGAHVDMATMFLNALPY